MKVIAYFFYLIGSLIILIGLLFMVSAPNALGVIYQIIFDLMSYRFGIFIYLLGISMLVFWFGCTIDLLYRINSTIEKLYNLQNK